MLIILKVINLYNQSQFGSLLRNNNNQCLQQNPQQIIKKYNQCSTQNEGIKHIEKKIKQLNIRLRKEKMNSASKKQKKKKKE